jgi:hypothetical protein
LSCLVAAVFANGTQRTRAAKGAINQKHAERLLAEIERNVFNGKLGIEERPRRAGQALDHRRAARREVRYRLQLA